MTTPDAPTPSFETRLRDLLPRLAAEAREHLERDRRARVAAVVATADARDRAALQAMRPSSVHAAPDDDLLVGLVPRAMVEPVLAKAVGYEPWLEQGWHPQSVLPVVVSTRGGHHFSFVPVAPTLGSSHM